MYPTGTETALDDLEASSLTEHHVRSWNTDVVENDVCVAVGSVVVAVDRQHALDGDSFYARRN